MDSKNVKKISPERIEQLKEIQDELAETQKLIQDVISGSITLSELAKAFGYDEQHSSYLVSRHLSPHFRRKNFLKPDEVLELLMDTASPYEKIAGAVFMGTKTKCPKDKLFIMTHTEETIMADAIETMLSDLEKEILSLRYGLYEEYPGGLSLRKIATLQNCSLERIRKIEARALRKLKSPELYYAIFPEYQDCLITLHDLEEIIRAKDFVSKESKAICDLCDTIRSHMVLLQMGGDVKHLNQALADKYHIKTSNDHIEDIGIEYLNLSVRTYNALKRYGCDKIHDVISLNERDLTCMHGLGKKGKQEIMNALAAYGLSPKKTVKKRKPAVTRTINPSDSIDLLDLPARSYNALKHNGCNTVQDIISLTEEDLMNIQGLGETSRREIFWTLASCGLSLKE